MLPKARRLASGDSNGSVLARGTFLPQKQRRRGRAAYLNAEFGTEHDEPPARGRQARHATSKLGLLNSVVELRKHHRAARLQHLRARQQERIDSETPSERAARLQDVRARQQERIDSETPSERAARLQDLRAHRQERIDSETPEETAARRQRDREAHSHRPSPVSAQPLLHQPAVQARMRKFHSQLASLEVSTCTTCLERFPGMTTRQTAASTVYIRCHRDTHSPKAYSREIE